MGQRSDKILIKKVANRVKEIRTKAGISQEEFYNDTEIHIGRIELAKSNIRITTLKDICAYFKISLVDFFKSIE